MDKFKDDKDLAKELAWARFYETGEIGAYMLYKKLCEDKNGCKSNKRDSTKNK